MDINEALQVINSLFDYLSEIGELDKEDFHRMNEAEDVINNYVRKTTVTRTAWWEPIISFVTGKPDGRYYCSYCRRVVDKCSIYCPDCGSEMEFEQRGNNNVL